MTTFSLNFLTHAYADKCTQVHHRPSVCMYMASYIIMYVHRYMNTHEITDVCGLSYRLLSFKKLHKKALFYMRVQSQILFNNLQYHMSFLMKKLLKIKTTG